MERLEDDVDGLAPALARLGVGIDAREEGDEERPAHQAEELDERGQHAEDRPGDEQGLVRTRSAAATTTATGASATAVSVKTHQVSTSRVPPARNRARTSLVGRRRMSG